MSRKSQSTNTTMTAPLSISTMKEDIHTAMNNPIMPRIKRNPHSGNTVTFAREQEDDPTSPVSITSPPISYNNMRSTSFSSAKVKIKPLLKKKSIETPSLDLSKSMAENEEMGIFFEPQRSALHTRSSSGVSIVTTGSVRYRQTQTTTPPMTRTRSTVGSSDDLVTSYAPVPKTSRTPPALHIRTHSTSSGPRIMSSSQTHLAYPPSASSLRGEPFSPESMGRSGRSSFDSVFRRRRANTDENPVAAAAAVREEWFAKQAAKQRKRDEDDARARERAERRQERMRSRSNTINTMNSSDIGSALGAVPYDSTRPALPVDRELEWIRAGKRPPVSRQTTSSTTIRKKARGTKNAFEKFFYDLYTAWLKMLSLVGVKRS